MSRDFNGTTDQITATITAMDSGDWTIGAWVNPDAAGENNSGVVLYLVNAGSVRQFVGFLSASRDLRAFQSFSTTSADSRSTDTLATGLWHCLFATYTSSDQKVRLYKGNLSTPVAEVSYAQQPAGVGTRNTGGTSAIIGNNTSGSATWDGRLGRVFSAARLWTVDEMEAFRQGSVPVTSGSLRGFWPLDSPTASRAEDMSGNGANGTVTGALVAEDPPIPFGLVGGPTLVLRPSLSVYTLDGSHGASASDAVGRLTSLIAVSSDTAAASDVSVRLSAFPRGAVDSAVADDALGRALLLNGVVGDTASASDALDRLATVNRPSTDSSTADDAVSRLQAVAVPASETAAADDHLQTTSFTNALRFFSEIAEAIDTATTGSTTTREPADSATADDSLGLLLALTVDQGEDASANDGIEALASMLVLSAEAAGVSDNLAIIHGTLIAGLDSAGAVDVLAALRSFGRNNADGAPAADFTEVPRVFFVAGLSTATGSDVLTVLTRRTRAISNTAGASDSRTIGRRYIRNLTDTAPAVPAPLVEAGRLLAMVEAVPAAVDNVVRIWSATRNATDNARPNSAGVVNSQTVRRSLIRTNLDSAPASDAALVEGGRLLVILEDISGLTDAISRTLTRLRSRTDDARPNSAGVVDALGIRRAYTRDASEAATTTDVASAVRAKLIAAIESLPTASDLVVWVFRFFRTSADAAAAADSLSINQDLRGWTADGTEDFSFAIDFTATLRVSPPIAYPPDRPEMAVLVP